MTFPAPEKLISNSTTLSDFNDLYDPCLQNVALTAWWSLVMLIRELWKMRLRLRRTAADMFGFPSALVDNPGEQDHKQGQKGKGHK